MAGSVTHTPHKPGQPLPLARGAHAITPNGAGFGPVLAGLLEAVEIQVNAKQSQNILSNNNSSTGLADDDGVESIGQSSDEGSNTGDTVEHDAPADSGNGDAEPVEYAAPLTVDTVELSDEAVDAPNWVADAPVDTEVPADANNDVPVVVEIPANLVAAPVAVVADKAPDSSNGKAPVVVDGSEPGNADLLPRGAKVQIVIETGTTPASPTVDADTPDQLEFVLPQPREGRSAMRDDGGTGHLDMAGATADDASDAAPSIETQFAADAANTGASDSDAPAPSANALKLISNAAKAQPAQPAAAHAHTQPYVATTETTEGEQPFAADSEPADAFEPVDAGADISVDGVDLSQAADDVLLTPAAQNVVASVRSSFAVAAQAPGQIVSPNAPASGQGAGASPAATVQAASSGQGGGEPGTGSDTNNGQNGAASRDAQAAQRAAGPQRTQFSRLLAERQHQTVLQVAKAIGLRGAIRTGGNISLLLKPESLGTLRLDLGYSNDGKLSVDALADNMATRHLLSGAADDLRAALKEYNIDLQRFNVQHDGGGTLGHAGTNNAGNGSAGGTGQGGNAIAGGTNGQAQSDNNDFTDEDNTGSVKLGNVDLTA